MPSSGMIDWLPGIEDCKSLQLLRLLAIVSNILSLITTTFTSTTIL